MATRQATKMIRVETCRSAAIMARRPATCMGPIIAKRPGPRFRPGRPARSAAAASESGDYAVTQGNGAEQQGQQPEDRTAHDPQRLAHFRAGHGMGGAVALGAAAGKPDQRYGQDQDRRGKHQYRAAPAEQAVQNVGRWEGDRPREAGDQADQE